MFVLWLLAFINLLHAQFFEASFSSAPLTENDNKIEDQAQEISEISSTLPTLLTTLTPAMEHPPDPFGRINEDDTPLEDRIDVLEAESQELVIDYVRNGRKMNGDIRRRLVLYVMRFSPVQNAVEQSRDPKLIQKIERIKYRFRTGMKIKYTSLKSRIDKLVAHLLAPIFAPFMLLQPDEIRPFFRSESQSQNTQFQEAVTIPPQQISSQQSSFTALEMFPSSLPQDRWPQFDARWMSPQAVPPIRPQFSMPSFTPFYQPFQAVRRF